MSSHREIRIGPYRLGRRIGAGSFGELYEGLNLETQEQVAIKLEHVQNKYPQLAWEYKVYSRLQIPGFPRIYWYGMEHEYSVLVMEYLGHNLEYLFQRRGRRFTLPTVLLLADQMLQRVQAVHEAGYIHRDIKPDNFVLGRTRSPSTPSRLLHCIDFGLAKRYRREEDGSHIPLRRGKTLIGTARYASIPNHQGWEQSRRDDLECLGYVWIYFLQGQLPWQGQRGPDRYFQIEQCKQQTPLEQLCRGLPPEFVTYLSTVRKYEFSTEPDYKQLRQLLRRVAERHGVNYDTQVYDWEEVS